ncbi:hypothetical protein D3C72_2389220 [compost metagenome]
MGACLPEPFDRGLRICRVGQGTEGVVSGPRRHGLKNPLLYSRRGLFRFLHGGEALGCAARRGGGAEREVDRGFSVDRRHSA